MAGDKKAGRVPDPDESLRRLIAAGEPTALSEIANLHFEEVTHFCIAMVRDGEAALEIAQDVFLTLLERHDRYDPSRPFRPWLYGIATHCCQGYLRKRRTTSARVFQMEDALSEVELIASDESDAFETLLHQRQREAILSAISALKEEWRAIVMLRFVEELSFIEIAELLGRPLSTITTNYYRALKALRRDPLLADLAPERRERRHG